MIFLSKPVKAQVAALSERVNGYTRSIRHIGYAVVIAALVALCCAGLAKYQFSMGITEVDIPESLLLEGAKTNYKFWSVSGFAEWVWWAIRHLWVLAGFYVLWLWALDYVKENGWKIKSLEHVGNIAVGIGMAFVVTFGTYIIPAGIDYVSGDFDLVQKVNQKPVRELIRAGDKGPISVDYIGEMKSLPERYVMAQVAIISNSDFPASFYKQLADDLQGASEFVPSENALFAIETAATGHPTSPRVVERATEVARHHTIASLIGGGSVGIALLLMGWGIGLFAIRRSITRRLASIQALIQGG
ncbi:TPA: hypothetical protein QHB43_004211 [Aeromonas hydrophila subsp. hydrophila]|nr:hypothetical protein [Aeromonas hydrophila subsp. hydrophila]